MTRILNKTSLLCVLSTAALLALSPAQAHSPYLKPSSFAPVSRDHITVEASFAEGDLRPDVAMISNHWSLTRPDGTTAPLTSSVSLKDATWLEVPISLKGTYRISSGERVGRLARAGEKDGALRFLEGPQAVLEEGETLVEVQSLTRVDVYVTKGSPTSLPIVGTGVEIAPLTPANDIYVGEEARFRVFRDGQPVAGIAVTLIQDGAAYSPSGYPDIALTADPDGVVTFTPSRPGLYLIQTRVRWPSAPAIWASYTATVTFEALPQ